MLKYEKRGVSSSKKDVYNAIRRLDKGLYPRAFCKILPDVAAGDPDWCNLLHADTAGTKTALAYLYWRETSDLSVWAGIAQDAIVMNLDDMACAGCTDDIILSNTIGRNRNTIPPVVIEALIEGTTHFIEKMRSQGIHLHLAGGETADVGDVVRTIDVGFTAFARMPRRQVVSVQIQPGDVIVGLASFGQAAYEDSYNGGMGCNGLTSARHDVLHRDYLSLYPETFDPDLPRAVTYTGNMHLTDLYDIGEGHSIPVGKLLLSPTRTYLPVIKDLLAVCGPSVHGIIHCTGGGQTKVLKFIQECHIIKDNLFDVPPLFEMICSNSHTDWEEMYQVFNMGHRMEVYLSPEYADTVISIAARYGIAARIIGRVEKADDERLTLVSPNGTFVYEANEPEIIS